MIDLAAAATTSEVVQAKGTQSSEFPIFACVFLYIPVSFETWTFCGTLLTSGMSVASSATASDLEENKEPEGMCTFNDISFRALLIALAHAPAAMFKSS